MFSKSVPIQALPTPEIINTVWAIQMTSIPLQLKEINFKTLQVIIFLLLKTKCHGIVDLLLRGSKRQTERPCREEFAYYSMVDMWDFLLSEIANCELHFRPFGKTRKYKKLFNGDEIIIN
jgi:hypothetical protein